MLDGLNAEQRKQLQKEIDSVTTIDQMIALFDSHLLSEEANKKSNGRVAANKKALNILKRLDGDFSKATEEDRQALREYSGLGGIGGSTNEYFTPEWVAGATWEALKAYGVNGNVLEPSGGVGVFADTKPKDTVMTSVELSETSAAINQILHPEDAVINASMEDFAKDADQEEFDAVIGNPPYGSRGSFANRDAEYKNINYADQYFVTRSIDKAKAGGLIALVLPTRIVEGSKLKDWRRSIALKAEFLGAHRLPSDVFAESGTKVVTDLVIWRKHSEEAKDIIDAAGGEELVKAGVLWDTWIKGTWFKHEGKKFVHGEESVIGKGQFARKIVDRGNRSNEQISELLSKKFDSRINWGELATVEPITNAYAEGDCRMMNGRMMKLEGGEWVAVNSEPETGKLDAQKYGFDRTDDIQTATYTPAGALNLTVDQAKAIYNDYRYLAEAPFKQTMRAVESLPEKYQERAYRGIQIGQMIKELQNEIDRGNSERAEELRTNLSGLVKSEYERFGAARNLKGFDKLPAEQQNSWLAFNQSFSDDGELSDLLESGLRREEVQHYNTDKAADVLQYWHRVNSTSAVTLDQFRKLYTGSLSDLTDDELVKQLAGMEGIAVNHDGTLSEMHRATSGHVVARIELLHQMITKSDSPELTANYQKQLDLINEKRGKIALTDIQMKLTDKWIPKDLILEWLHEQGYGDFILGRFIYDEDGEAVDFDETYRGDDAIFTGYNWRDGEWVDGKKSHKDKHGNPASNIGKKLSNVENEKGIEDYLNRDTVRRGGNKNELQSIFRDTLRQLDSDFSLWCAGGGYADELEAEYNNRFNGYIEPEHDDSDLELENVSGAIKFMGFQNATIRRHSNDGGGIIGFGTGLGKTLTGYGLIQYNHQLGRSKRTAVVVPKSVLENWFYEADLLHGEANLKDFMFVGIEPKMGENGQLAREPVLDDDGNPRLDKKGDPIYRPILSVDTSTKKVAPQLHKIAQSKVKTVVMTKDVYKSIPLKEETIADNVTDMVNAGLVAGSNDFAKVAENYREQQKKDNFERKHSDDGSAKKGQLPYFEDLLFDSVLVDEGHEYRNSYQAGSYGRKLEFLPSPQTAQAALDMQIKNNFIKRKNDGRGVYMLTATPAVNSPIDVFNMLSQVAPPEALARLGISDNDDFIRLFGRTGEATIHKLSGETVQNDALLGFQNLEALRKLFNRYVTIKEQKDVNNEVHIPELETLTNPVDLSPEQIEIYEELRQRADAISNPDDPLHEEIIEQYPDDTIFGLIRQMDKATTDLDLYNGVITYRFSNRNKAKVQELIEALPKTIKVERKDFDVKEGEWKKVKRDEPLNPELKAEGKQLILTVTQEADQHVIKQIDKLKLKFTHPVPPKYAKFLELAKEVYLKGGKQLVFTEEKSQHVKLARIISQFVGCKINEIGIINSDTVAGKKGSKASEDDEAAGLEAIAKQYNTGKTKFIIANKKAEVGVNLHHGTTDIHHLTLAFTPASMTQRNGRGARVGSKAAKVKVHYYAGKGSFDAFRIRTIERKAKWINELLTGDAKYADNSDADSAKEASIMLASNPEEAKRRQAEAEAAQKRKLAAIAERNAAVALEQLKSAVKASSVNMDELNAELEQANERIARHKEELEKADSDSMRVFWNNELFNSQNKASKIQNQIAKVESSKSAIKRHQNTLKGATANGISDNYPDLLTHPENYITVKGRILRKGYSYNIMVDANSGGGKVSIVGVFKKVAGVSYGRSAGASETKYTFTKTGDDSKYAGWAGQETHIVSSDILGLAEVNQTENELIARCQAQEFSPSDITNQMDKETFFDMINRGYLTSFSGSQRALGIHDGNIVTIWNMDDSEGTPIYPDMTDKSWQELMKKQLLEGLEDNGKLPHWSNYVSSYLGNSWQDDVKAMGNNATEAQVIKWFETEVKALQEDLADQYKSALRGSHHSYQQAVREHFTGYQLTGYVNTREIARWQSSAQMQHFNKVKAESGEYLTKGNDVAFAEYTKLVSNDSGRAKRLKSVLALAEKYKSEHHFVTNARPLYPSDDSEFAITLYADLTAIDVMEPLSEGKKLFEEARWADSDLRYCHGWKREKFVSGVGTLLESEKPPAKEVPLTEKQQDKIEAIENISGDFAEVRDALAEIGITIKPNSGDMVHKWKRYKTNMPAYQWYGLFDENGKGGALGSAFAGRNNPNKETFKPKFSKDIAEEFTGAWWFVSNEINLAELTKLLLSQ